MLNFTSWQPWWWYVTLIIQCKFWNSVFCNIANSQISIRLGTECNLITQKSMLAFLLPLYSVGGIPSGNEFSGDIKCDSRKPAAAQFHYICSSPLCAPLLWRSYFVKTKRGTIWGKEILRSVGLQICSLYLFVGMQVRFVCCFRKFSVLLVHCSAFYCRCCRRSLESVLLGESFSQRVLNI